MCLSVPAKIESIEGDTANCSIGGATLSVSLRLLDHSSIRIGDYVLVHAGFALQLISPDEARTTLELFKEYEAINIMPDQQNESNNSMT
ncbi:MAG: HypC/HybG/HupF family hydrogenase formation chaperone [Bacteroidales bacterium]|nr:HypC/HybG/HupF family hydrogenase formation chaperone [Bacteroidales bacterium]